MKICKIESAKKVFVPMTLTFFILFTSLSYAVDESITITATVPSWAVIEPSTNSARVMLDGHPGAAEYNETLLTLNLSHNSATGYTLELKSLNNGKLIGTRDTTRTIPYKISYDSQSPIALTTTPQDVGGATTSATGAATTPFTKVVDIIISNTHASQATNQDYEDTIVFTLTGI